MPEMMKQLRPTEEVRFEKKSYNSCSLSRVKCIISAVLGHLKKSCWHFFLVPFCGNFASLRSIFVSLCACLYVCVACLCCLLACLCPHFQKGHVNIYSHRTNQSRRPLVSLLCANDPNNSFIAISSVIRSISSDVHLSCTFSPMQLKDTSCPHLFLTVTHSDTKQLLKLRSSAEAVRHTNLLEDLT